jgi:peptide-methionine (S)-S-oxide reductase
LAERSKKAEETRTGKKVYTELRPAETFYTAETYHQKYMLQGYAELIKEFREMYPADEDLINSTAAARVNGYVTGYGNLEILQKEIDMYGLSPEGEEKLLDIVSAKIK